MTNSEFKYEFDIMWNNIMSNQAPGLSTYEISTFLTQAQESIVKGIYSGSITNPFETTEDARSYLSPLVCHGYPTKIEESESYPHVIFNTVLYDIDNIKNDEGQIIDKAWFIVYESVIFDNNKYGIVKPVTHDTFWEINRNPFKQANERRVLRLSFNFKNKNVVELVTTDTIKTYFIRYIRKPKPIILEDLEDDLTIDGESKASECELNESLHRAILDTAIKMAKQAWILTRQPETE